MGRTRRVARFRLMGFQRLLDPQHALEAFLRAKNETERLREARTMIAIVQYYAPLIPLVVDVENAFVQPWLQGYVPSSLAAHFQYLDIAGERPH